MVSKKNKQDFFVRNWVVKDTSCYLRNVQLHPHVISKVRCVSIYIHDVYVDRNAPCINYSPNATMVIYGILFYDMHPVVFFTLDVYVD